MYPIRRSEERKTMTESKFTAVGIETFTCEICGEEKSVFERYKDEQTGNYVCESHAMSDQIEDMSDGAVSNENPFGTELARRFA